MHRAVGAGGGAAVHPPRRRFFGAPPRQSHGGARLFSDAFFPSRPPFPLFQLFLFSPLKWGGKYVIIVDETAKKRKEIP